MEHQELIDKIIKDAKDEAATIVNTVKKMSKANVAYSKEQAEERVRTALETAKKNKALDLEIKRGACDIKRRLAILEQKTQILDSVFAKAMDNVKYKFRVEQHPNYELRLTREEFEADLRQQIENQVVEILFGGESE